MKLGIILLLHEKRETRGCASYRGITLANIAKIIEEGLKEELNTILEATKYGFRKGSKRTRSNFHTEADQ